MPRAYRPLRLPPARTFVLVQGHPPSAKVPVAIRISVEESVVTRTRARLGLALVAMVAVACQPQGQVRTVDLEPRNYSGVEGTVTLTEVSATRTRVVISVDPAGNPDMPAHMHPGTCDDLVPQPLYSLANVMMGESVTEVPVSLTELLAERPAVNIHKSNDEMGVYTACAEVH